MENLDYKEACCMAAAFMSALYAVIRLAHSRGEFTLEAVVAAIDEWNREFDFVGDGTDTASAEQIADVRAKIDEMVEYLDENTEDWIGRMKALMGSFFANYVEASENQNLPFAMCVGMAMLEMAFNPMDAIGRMRGMDELLRVG